jgi:hypothetical protein
MPYMNFRQPDPGGIFRGAARSVIRMVSDTESGKWLPPDGSPRLSAPSSDIFGSFQGLVTIAMLTRLAIPRLLDDKSFKYDRHCYFKTLVN